MQKKRRSGVVIGEAERRAGILDRYVAKRLPTAEDDATTASELGLSTESMTRLAAVWRRHRDPTLLVGQTAALAVGRHASRDDIMAERIDLEGVIPGRRDETLRRIRIMQRHIAATEAGAGDVAAAAAEMGVSPTRFDVVLRTWILHAAADALPGATRRNTPWRRKPTHLRRLELARTAAAAAGDGESVRAAYDRFVRDCADEDIEPLSLKRFYAIAAVVRASARGIEDAPDA